MLILLPGLLCDAALWRDQVAALGDAVSCRVGDLSQGESIAELAETVLATAPPTFALAGFSLGGYVAQEMVRLAPERVERLALLDTSCRADTPERQQTRQAMAEAARRPGRFLGIADRMLPTFIHPDRLEDADLTDRIRSMTQRVGRDVFVRQTLMTRHDGEAVLRALDCPVLVLCGRQDGLTSLASHEAMAGFIPGATLVVVEACGHMAPMERPEAVTSALQAWLSR